MRGRSAGRGGREIVASKSVDYSDNVRDSTLERRKARSKSTEDVTVAQGMQAGRGGRGVMSQQQQTELILQQPPYPMTRFAELPYDLNANVFRLNYEYLLIGEVWHQNLQLEQIQ